MNVRRFWSFRGAVARGQAAFDAQGPGLEVQLGRRDGAERRDVHLVQILGQVARPELTDVFGLDPQLAQLGRGRQVDGEQVEPARVQAAVHGVLQLGVDARGHRFVLVGHGQVERGGVVHLIHEALGVHVGGESDEELLDDQQLPLDPVDRVAVVGEVRVRGQAVVLPDARAPVQRHPPHLEPTDGRVDFAPGAPQREVGQGLGSVRFRRVRVADRSGQIVLVGVGCPGDHVAGNHEAVTPDDVVEPLEVDVERHVVRQQELRPEPEAVLHVQRKPLGFVQLSVEGQRVESAGPRAICALELHLGRVRFGTQDSEHDKQQSGGFAPAEGCGEVHVPAPANTPPCPCTLEAFDVDCDSGGF